MTLTLLSALILGLILGPLARLILPGRRDISLVLTVLIGAAGALIGSAVVATMNDRSGFDFLALLAGLGASVVLVVLYGLIFGHDEQRPR